MAYKYLLFSLAGLGLVWASPPTIHAKEPPATVVVEGRARIRAAPDLAYVTLAVESRDPNPRAAQQANAKISDAVLKKLRTAGLGENALRTLSYGLQEEFDYNKGQRKSRGYLARNQLEVRVDDIAQVGEIIDLATGAGATSVQGLHFDVKDRSDLERDALRQAVADGQARARAAAAGAEGRIGRLVRIEQAGTSRPPGPRPQRRGAVTMSAQASQAPAIEAGEIEISAAVTVTAELQ